MKWIDRILGRKKNAESGKPFGELIMVDGKARMKITRQAEKSLKDYYDLSMNPREWMARYGHNIIVGDARINIYRDKQLEKWIHQAFSALWDEGLEKLWAEFLTEEETRANKDAYETP